MPRPVKDLSVLEVASACSRIATWPSPYKSRVASPIKKAPMPTEMGTSMGPGSVTRSRARRARLARSPVRFPDYGDILIPGVVIRSGSCGGAHGPIERQQRNEARFQAKLASEERARREASLVAEATGGRSIDEWRDAAAESFLRRPPVARPSPSADAARQLTADPSADTSVRPSGLSPSPPSKLPPLMVPALPQGCAQERKLRGARLKPGYEHLQRRGGYEDDV